MAISVPASACGFTGARRRHSRSSTASTASRIWPRSHTTPSRRPPAAMSTRRSTTHRRAGDQAAASLAYEEATRLYRMALDALELKAPLDEAIRCELLLSLGDAEDRGGDLVSAKRDVRPGRRCRPQVERVRAARPRRARIRREVRVVPGGKDRRSSPCSRTPSTRCRKRDRCGRGFSRGSAARFAITPFPSGAHRSPARRSRSPAGWTIPRRSRMRSQEATRPLLASGDGGNGWRWEGR